MLGYDQKAAEKIVDLYSRQKILNSLEEYILAREEVGQ